VACHGAHARVPEVQALERRGLRHPLEEVDHGLVGVVGRPPQLRLLGRLAVAAEQVHGRQGLALVQDHRQVVDPVAPTVVPGKPVATTAAAAAAAAAGGPAQGLRGGEA
jgi:hypothetical protein